MAAAGIYRLCDSRRSIYRLLIYRLFTYRTLVILTIAIGGLSRCCSARAV